MPDESCRDCGGELVRCSLCSKCRKAIQWVCLKCAKKTHEAFHPTCLGLENYQVVGARNQWVATPYQNVNDNQKISKNQRRRWLNFILIALPIVIGCIVVFDLGTGGNIVSGIIQETAVSNIINYKYYDNCLAQSNGAIMTISCPTSYGTVYKAFTTIPKELGLELKKEIFSLRGLAALESHDTVIIEYQKKMYAAVLVHH